MTANNNNILIENERHLTHKFFYILALSQNEFQASLK